MTRSIPIALLLCLTLGGCPGTAALTAADTTLATAAKVVQDGQNAVTAYGIAKGLAQVAVTVDPSLGAIVNPVIAITDPKVSQLNTLVQEGADDAATLQALVTDISTAAQAITNNAAGKVTATPATNPTPAPAAAVAAAQAIAASTASTASTASPTTN